MFPLKKNNTPEKSHCSSWYICFSSYSCSVEKASFGFCLKSPKSSCLDLGMHLLTPCAACVLGHALKVSIPVRFSKWKIVVFVFFFSSPCICMYFYGVIFPKREPTIWRKWSLASAEPGLIAWIWLPLETANAMLSQLVCLGYQMCLSRRPWCSFPFSQDVTVDLPAGLLRPMYIYRRWRRSSCGAVRTSFRAEGQWLNSWKRWQSLLCLTAKQYYPRPS